MYVSLLLSHEKSKENWGVGKKQTFGRLSNVKAGTIDTATYLHEFEIGDVLLILKMFLRDVTTNSQVLQNHKLLVRKTIDAIINTCVTYFFVLFSYIHKINAMIKQVLNGKLVKL